MVLCVKIFFDFRYVLYATDFIFLLFYFYVRLQVDLDVIERICTKHSKNNMYDHWNRFQLIECIEVGDSL